MADSAERQRRFRERQRAKGFVQVTLLAPSHQVPDLMVMAKRLCENADLEVAAAPLRSASTGRLVKLV